VVGFLAPQIGVLNSGVRGTGVGPADTSVGDALTGIANLINLTTTVGNRGGGPTQKDRDNETLQDFSAEVARLHSMRGELGESQFNSQLNSKFKAFGVVNPILIGDARDVVLGQTGIKIGGEEFSLKKQQQQIVESFTATARGKSALVRIFAAPGAKDPATGEMIPEIVFSMLSAEAALAAKDEAELEAINLQLASLKGREEIRTLLEKDIIDKKTFEFGQRSEATVAGLSMAAFEAGVKVKDASVLVGDLLREKQAAENEYFAEARAGGFADSPDFKTGLAAALQPYDTMIGLIEDLGDESVRAFAVLQASDSIITAKVINKIIKFGGTNRDVVAYFMKSVIDNNVVDLRMISTLDPTELRDELGDRPLFPGNATTISAEAPPAPGPVATPETISRARTLTDQEREDEVRVNTSTFSMFSSDDEDSRTTAVKAFGLAATAINTSTLPLAEATFDRLYDTKFFDTYNTIVGFGDQNSANLQGAVQENLTRVLQQRLGLANVDLRNRFSETFPEINLVSDGNEIVLDLGKGLTPNSRFLTKSLERHNLPKTVQGLKQLAILEFNNPFFTFFSEANGINELIAEVAYVNKIIGTVKRLPDIAPHILPSIGVKVDPVTGDPIPDFAEEEEVSHITSLGELDNVAIGSTFSYIDTDGKLVVSTFGGV